MKKIIILILCFFAYGETPKKTCLNLEKDTTLIKTLLEWLEINIEIKSPRKDSNNIIHNDTDKVYVERRK